MLFVEDYGCRAIAHAISIMVGLGLLRFRS